MNWLKYSSPQTFYPLAGRLAPLFWALAVVLCAIGLILGLLVAPTDFQQGDSYRIIYIHVPAAWMSMFIYLVMAIWAATGLVVNTRLSSMMASALAPTGALMTFIVGLVEYGAGIGTALILTLIFKLFGGLRHDDGAENWLSEGFTDWTAFRVSAGSGHWTAEQFARAFNEKLQAYDLSPEREADNARIVSGFWSSRHLQELPYQRGLLMARAAVGQKDHLVLAAHTVYSTVQPPSIATAAPVIKLDASLAKKTAKP